MADTEKYLRVNIREYLNIEKPTYIGEEGLCEILSDFSCPKNPDVEYFLQHSAIEFTKKSQSVTYLVFDSEDGALVGYFAIALKPLSMKVDGISKNVSKKLDRIGDFDNETQTYSMAACLIAQLGKNYAMPKEKQISGEILLGFALDEIKSVNEIIGGLVEFIECEDNEFLLKFYQENKFRKFDTRYTLSKHDGKQHLLHQLFKFI